MTSQWALCSEVMKSSTAPRVLPAQLWEPQGLPDHGLGYLRQAPHSSVGISRVLKHIWGESWSLRNCLAVLGVESVAGWPGSDLG